MTYRITSWNINSIRIRIPLVQQFVQAHQPDIVCLQETKTRDELFPHDALEQLGFTHQYICGQKSYNGVAILSKQELRNIERNDILGNGECRHIAATLPDGTRLHNVYVPAGGEEPDPNINPKFRDKLAFMRKLTDFSNKHIPASHPTIILGDMNIAPLEQDVWSHKQLLNVVSHTPVEVEHMQALQQASDWVDCLRHYVPEEEKLYSWWSYRARDWQDSNRGRRLDHIWITPALKQRLKNGMITKEARGWASPSDHAPVSIDLEAA